MTKDVEYLIKSNALYGYPIFLEEEMGSFTCPTMDSLQGKMAIYLSLATNFIDIYEEKLDKFYETILGNEDYLSEFATLLVLFFNCEKVQWNTGRLQIGENHFISNKNVTIFMETLRVLHHKNKASDRYVFANQLAADMMAEANRREAELNKKIKSKDGLTFLEISSTVCARHPSINPDNIGKLNYYQILDQYKRLMLIDIYTPCLYGNATEEYVRKNNVKHYSAELVNT